MVLAIPTQQAAADQVINDDLIVTFSECIGNDCVNGESFGFDTLRLKENNLRIKFEDTSASASFPTNDWQITANDSTDGGANKFSIDDIDGGKTPFTIEAGAPNHSLYVDDGGRIGLGTSTPVVELHTVDSDTPTLRLEQDGSGGWTPQTWDIAGNESNFFIRDVTNGSRLPFRIQPGCPTSTLYLKSDGKVGIGTQSPDFSMEMEVTGEIAAFGINRTDGATAKIQAGASGTQFGSVTNHKLHLFVNDLKKVTIDTNNYVGISDTTPDYPLDMGTLANEAHCTTGGVWTDASSREYKDNITVLTGDEANLVVAQLNPVKYNYKVDKDEKHVGFIAEDVPDLVATKDRKGMSSMDVVAVLTKVVQEQQKTISELKARMAKFEREFKEKQNP
jgi:hypothetical protein